MRIYRSVNGLPPGARGAVLALGNFDGVHIGHRAVLEEARLRAESLGAMPAVLTFRPHPREFFDPASAPLSLNPFRVKARLLEEAGMQALFVLRFDEALAGMSAEEFVQRVLVEKLSVRHAVTGTNFTFGKGRGGDAAMLAALGERFGFEASAVPPVNVEDEPCSSSRTRALLEGGEVEQAARLLGRPYAIEGQVRRGDARGRQLGFPTANIALEQIFAPARGVYAVRARWEGGAWRDGVANLGIRPSFGGIEPRLEVHCFDATGDLYGKRLTVQLLTRLREERAFSGPDVLKTQIMQDCLQAREALGRL